ncbi:ATP-binding protein, partial [Candidatus Skiveiella danica]|uniref:ATP-binding protein n=1 Tax=Candidatus Skiveiella danica TaxID=3386177 RepID=UPI0039B98FD6
MEKDLELACEIQNEVPSAIIGDPNRVSQVLINLLSNAIKFTETGEVSLLVSRGQAARPVNGNVEIQFSVRDTGIGIAADQVAKLFQPF